MGLRTFFVLAALLTSLAPAQEICSVTGTAQKIAAKSACCETACSHCDGKSSESKEKASPLCMENQRSPAVNPDSIKTFSEAQTAPPLYSLPESISTKTGSVIWNRLNASPPFYTGGVLLSVVLRS